MNDIDQYAQAYYRTTVSEQPSNNSGYEVTRLG